MKYKQPDFYHFNEDSITLVNCAIDYLGNQRVHNLLDIGAGCGIVGIDFCQKKTNIEKVHFLELQQDFFESLGQNIKNFLPESMDYECIHSGFESYNPKVKFDIILCNPPYFIEGASRSSSDSRRHRCRTFNSESPKKLMNKILNLLSEKGLAFLLVPKNIKQWDDIITSKTYELKIVKVLKNVQVCLVRKVNLN